MNKRIVLLVMGASFILAPFFSAHAEVVVVESESTQESMLAKSIEKTNKQNAELYSQLQLLQEEVMRTRGGMEELQHDLAELKRQRKEDYDNLDKRITELGTVATTQSDAQIVVPVETLPADQTNLDAITPGGLAPVVLPSVPITQLVASLQDSTDYQKAYDLLKQRKFDEAKSAFNAFLTKYPVSESRPNVYYWLGELYIIDGNFIEAKKSFQTVLKSYPDHPKYPDALYKVATVNYELGDRLTAKQQLEELTKYKDQSVSAVPKARDFLRKNNLN